MNTIEAMKQALEAMTDKAWDEEGYCLDPDLAESADDLRAAIAELEQAQPVAYEITTINHSYDPPESRTSKWLDHDFDHFKFNHAKCLEIVKVTPLYTHPAPQPPKE